MTRYALQEVKRVRGVATGASVRGRVLFEGNAVPYCGIAFTQPHIRRGGGHETIRDVDGRFTLRGLEAGTWQLTLVGPGTRAKRLEPITVESGESIEVGDIILEPGQRITGHVRDVAGAPVAEARVFIGPGPRVPAQQEEIVLWLMGWYETRTDSRGMYVFDGIDIPERTGPRFIWTTQPTIGASILRDVRADDSTVDLEFLRTGRIEGVVEGLRAGPPLVFARRSDEPEHARGQLPGGGGGFRFYDVPPGEYEVSLRVPKTVQAPPVRVTVVEGQAASVRLTMVTSAVQLTVTVPRGRGMDLVLASADSNTPEPEQMTPKLIVGEAKITMRNGPSPPWTGKERVQFDYLQPGTYRASIDGETWTPIVVAESPEHQRFEIRAD